MNKDYTEEETKVVDLDGLEDKMQDEEFYDKDIADKNIEDEEENDEIEDSEEQDSEKQDEEVEERKDEDQKEEKSKEGKKEESKESKPKKKNNKKLYIIIGVISALIILGIILLIIFIPKKNDNNKTKDKDVEDKSKSESQFVKTLNSALKSGDLAKEINKGLKDSNITTDKVHLLNIDIDKDGKQELVVYAEDSSKKYILQFEIGDEVTYEDSFQLDSRDSFGYAYSVSSDRNYFYSKYEGNYTIIGKQKKVIKEADFMDDYFVIVNTYKNTPILNNSIEYDLENSFDVEKLDKNEINEETLLKDNDIGENEIRPAAEDYFKKKKTEEEEKKKAEEEKKKAEEEAAKKEQESSFKLNNKTLHYGKYSQEKTTIEYVIINSNGSGEIDGNSCTWKFGKHNFAQDSSEDEELESVNFNCTDGDYYLTAFENDKLGDGGTINLTLEKE